ncbi:MAG: hypothetical protein ACK4P1_03670 [Aggregatilineales bacterium]
MTALEYLSVQIEQVRRRFEAQLGEASLCEVTKDGRVTDGLKYAEGRLVALCNLERRLRAEEAHEAALAAETAYWRALYERHAAMAWRAYAQGGWDACAECLNALLTSS